jgi:hypothetical protein
MPRGEHEVDLRAGQTSKEVVGRRSRSRSLSSAIRAECSRGYRLGLRLAAPRATQSRGHAPTARHPGVSGLTQLFTWDGSTRSACPKRSARRTARGARARRHAHDEWKDGKPDGRADAAFSAKARDGASMRLLACGADEQGGGRKEVNIPISEFGYQSGVLAWLPPWPWPRRPGAGDTVAGTRPGVTGLTNVQIFKGRSLNFKSLEENAPMREFPIN